MESQILPTQSNSKIKSMLVAGVAATIIIAIFMEGLSLIFLGAPLKPAAMICQLMGWDNSMLWAGEIIHYTITLLLVPISFVLVRAIFARPPSVLVGSVWGFIVWSLLAVFVAPKAGMPVFFGGGKLMVASMLSHVAYGATLGFVYGKLRPVVS